MATDGLRTFPAAPIPLQVPGEAGVPAYPALLDEGDSVALRIFADRQQAQEAHPLGVRRLLEIALAEKVKQARKQLPVGAKTGLLYAAIESQERLRGDLVDAAMNAVLAEGLEDIRDAAFEQRREHAAKALFGEAMSRLKLAESILALVAELKPLLEAPLMGWARGNLDDMEAQLAGLIHPGFLRDTPAALAQYPRYLKAMILRTERAKRDPPRDQARMLELHPFLEALEAGEQQGLRDRALAGAALGSGRAAGVVVRAGAGARTGISAKSWRSGGCTSPGVNARHGRPIGRPWPPAWIRHGRNARALRCDEPSVARSPRPPSCTRRPSRLGAC